ncbi:NUDIX hydrolase [Candidatus Omnitrophota bacterium]
MMAKREFSAGGIVVRKKGRTLEVLLIKDAYGHWSWPKGHIDQGESSKDAAIREIREEVGLSGLAILDKVGRINYFYRLKGDLIFKTVFFFLAETGNDQKLKAQKSEIQAARWFKASLALKTLKYKGTKELLEKAIIKYKEVKKCTR